MIFAYCKQIEKNYAKRDPKSRAFWSKSAPWAARRPSREAPRTALLVAVVAAGSVLASIYNTMNERRREFAILRALGAGRVTAFGVIVLESATIATMGAVIGFAVYAGIMFAAESILRNEIGVTLHPFEQHPVMVIVPVGLVMLGVVVGIIPALKAYRTEVAENLIPQS